VEIIDGVPDGWKKGTLGNIADNVGKTEKKEKRDNYAYYLPIDCLPKKSLAYTDFNDIALAESSLIAFKANDILFGAMRPYFHKVVIARDEGLTRSTCFVINSKQDYMWSYLTMLLFSVDTINYATRISVGTTMPYVRWKDFVQMPVLIPNENVAIAFKKQFMSIADKITKLAKQNIYLSQARDRLLPTLMNGEIEV
jgi:type I restriction enzyme S subunit